MKEADSVLWAGMKGTLGFQMQRFSSMTEVSNLQAEVKPPALHVVWIWLYKKAIQENCRGEGWIPAMELRSHMPGSAARMNT